MLRCFFAAFFVFFSTTMVHGVERSVDYRIGEEVFQGYYVSPVQNHAPLVILVHDWDGLTAYEKRRATMLSELGYAVFLLDMFGKDVRPVTIEEKRALTSSLYNNRSRMKSLLKAGLQAAEKQGLKIKDSVIAGYCFGGAVVLELARSGEELKGFVSFHGGLETPDGQDYSQTKGDILILHGTADRAVSMDDFMKLAKELEESGVKHEMITYGGAPHAFTVFDSDRYRQDADEKSWVRFNLFLSEHLRKEGGEKNR